MGSIRPFGSDRHFVKFLIGHVMCGIYGRKYHYIYFAFKLMSEGYVCGKLET